MDYQLMDVPPPGTQSRSSYRLFLVGYLVVESIGGAMMALLGVWLNSYAKPGFGFDTDRLFKFHPLFMTVGLVFLNSKAMLMYRLLRNYRKLPVKIAHGCLNLLALGMSIAGLVAVVKHKFDVGYPHFFSLHSWVGIGTMGLFVLQWVAGFLVFLYPGGSPPVRAVALRVHRFCGSAIFLLAVATILTGAVTLAADIPDYVKLSWSACVLNAFSVTLVAFGLAVQLLMSVAEFRRPPS